MLKIDKMQGGKRIISLKDPVEILKEEARNMLLSYHDYTSIQVYNNILEIHHLADKKLKIKFDSFDSALGFKIELILLKEKQRQQTIAEHDA